MAAIIGGSAFPAADCGSPLKDGIENQRTPPAPVLLAKSRGGRAVAALNLPTMSRGAIGCQSSCKLRRFPPAAKVQRLMRGT
jgi:hypothetical protein